jgi:hypothetical protein
MIKNLFIVATLILTPAFDKPAQPGKYSKYFTTLHTEGTYPGWCCNVSDCKSVEAYFDPEQKQWFAFISKEVYGADSGAPDAWVAVPQSAHVVGTEDAIRPQRATACWYNKILRCFDPPAIGG